MRKISLVLLTAIFIVFSVGKTGQVLAESSQTGPKIDEDTLKPGLAVVYIYGFWRHIDQMLTDGKANQKAKPGKPIPLINHQFERGLVFDSGVTRGVGMKMTGFIRLPKSGKYGFMAKSNDGIRVFVIDQMVINDPTGHPARFSEPGSVEISDPGWYPLKILYFQRKGTAALEMHWKRPGDEAFSIIPAEAYAHVASTVEKK